MTASEGHAAAGLRVAFATPALRRCQTTAAVARVVDAATLVAVSVHLFGRAGATAVALFGVVRTLVPALGTPLVTAVASRLAPGPVVAACLGGAAVASAASAWLVATEGSVVAILVLAGVTGLALTCLRPMVSALLPDLIHGPASLVATNAAAALLDNLATVAGPVLAGAAVATVGASWVLWAAAALLAVVGVSVIGLAVEGAYRPARTRGLLTDVLDGVRGCWSNPGMRLVVVCTTAQTVVRGGVNVLVVALAIDRLGLGDGGVGLLLGAIGMGGLVGFPLAMRVAGRGRMARVLGAGLVLWGTPVVAAGLLGAPVVVVALFGVIGFGNTLVDIGSDTLLQRLAPSGSLARVLGAFDALLYAGMALGAVAAERLLATGGLSLALVTLGLVLPVLTVAVWWALRRVDLELDSRDADVALLQLNGIFSPLVLATVDRLVDHATTCTFAPGEAIVVEGDPGQHFHLIESGQVEVVTSGEVVAVLADGDGFGELSLLDGTPRNATVLARTVVRTRSLGREDFLGALDSHDAAHAAAMDLAEPRRRTPT